MKQTFVANSLWGVMVQSTLLSKVILIMASVSLIVCLFIFIYKLLLLREKNKQIAQVQASIQSAETLDDILSLGATLKGTLPGALLGRGLVALKSLLHHSAHGEDKKLTEKDFELLQDVLDQSLQDVMVREHEYVSVISVSAAVAPLVGLFGTITGLMQAFIAIAQQKSSDISAIAPGIAEALLTTFAGLVVAIPGFILYHYLVARINNLEHHLVALMHRFEWVVKKILT
jgi:biopolymer transport protein TolQ